MLYKIVVRIRSLQKYTFYRLILVCTIFGDDGPYKIRTFKILENWIILAAVMQNQHHTYERIHVKIWQDLHLENLQSSINLCESKNLKTLLFSF